MECSICSERFSGEERRPKSLPCGHSFCVQCLRQLPARECPVDRKRFSAAVDCLPDNYMLVELLEQQQQQAEARRLWCRECNKEAGDACLEEHALCSLKKARSDRTGQLWEERSNAVELDDAAMARRLTTGCYVSRRRHGQARVREQGRCFGELGVVVRKSGSFVTVEWRSGSSGVYVMGPRSAGWASGTMYDLNLLPGVRFMILAGHRRGSSTFLDVREESSSEDTARKLKFLTNQPLERVRALMDMRCDVSPPWSLEVLRRVAPRLKGLRLLRPDAVHLRLAQGMPNLTTLYLSPADTDVLQTALSMPGIRTLVADCPFEAPLGTLQLPQESRLTFLCLGVYPLRAAMAVVRSQAATLGKLGLMAASREPYGCLDLAAELRRCGLKKLTSFRLCRRSDFEFCQHDVDSCRVQKLQLQKMFVETGLKVTVQCSICDDV